jgi:RNA polymerase sigma-70 factor, ECF subfamily
MFTSAIVASANRSSPSLFAFARPHGSIAVDGGLSVVELPELFRRARAGEDDAVRALVLRMRPKLFGVAYSIVQDAAAADDVAQHAMIRILTKSALFAGLGSLEGWMLRIANNAAKNHRRDHQRRQQLMNQSGHTELQVRGALASAPDAADDRLHHHQRIEQLRAALQQLPERQREVVQLRAVAGLSFALVASTLGISEANARMAFSNAKKHLQKTLEPS